MADVTRMSGDLSQAMAEHLIDSSSLMSETAGRMANAAMSVSSPAYGIVVDAKVRSDIAEMRQRVDVEVRETAGIGVVYGGASAARRAVDRAMASIAEAEDLVSDW